MPPSLASEPTLNWVLAAYAKAYLDLERRRQIGYASGQPLTPEAITSYGYAHGFGPDIEFYYRAISAMDDDYIESEAERMKRNTAKSKSAKPSKPPRRGRRK